MAKTKPESSKPAVSPGSTAASALDQTNGGASQQGKNTSTSTDQDGAATGTTDAANIAAGATQADPATPPANSAVSSETQPQPAAGTEAISFPIADEDTDRARAALATGLRSLGFDVELLQGKTAGAEEHVETRRFEALKPVRHNNVFYPIGSRLRVTREEHAELADAGVVDPDWDEDED